MIMGITATNAGADRTARARSALGHSSVYGFLAGVFRREITAKLLHELRQPALVEALAATARGEDVGPFVPMDPDARIVTDLPSLEEHFYR